MFGKRITDVTFLYKTITKLPNKILPCMFLLFPMFPMYPKDVPEVPQVPQVPIDSDIVWQTYYRCQVYCSENLTHYLPSHSACAESCLAVANQY